MMFQFPVEVVTSYTCINIQIKDLSVACAAVFQDIDYNYLVST